MPYYTGTEDSLIENRTRIGNWEIFHSETLLLLENQQATLILTPDASEPLKLNVKFEVRDEPERKEKSYVSISGKNNEGGFLFVNWDSPVGALTSEPLVFAKSDQGNTIAAMCHSQRIGKAHKIFMQFMVERAA